MPRFFLLSCLLCLLALAGCSSSDPDPVECPGGPDGGVSPGFVIDRQIQQVIQFYQVTLIADTTKDGQAITCDDIPGTFRPNDPRVTILATYQVKRDKLDTDPELATGIKIPSDKRLLLVAEGIATDKVGAAHIVARGCQEGIQIKPCATPVLQVDLVATSGRACNSVSECESGMQCLKGATFLGGYCAVVGCASGKLCPPGASCVADTTYAGVCGRDCTKISDCISTGIQPQQECLCRKAATQSGQVYVCGDNRWAKDIACSSADGGI